MKTISKKIIEHIESDSHIDMVEEFCDAINLLVKKKVNARRKELGKNLFTAEAKRIEIDEDLVYTPDRINDELAHAIDYVINEVENNGDGMLTAAMGAAAKKFAVTEKDLQNYFTGEGDEISESLLTQLVKISSAPEEGEVILEGSSVPVSITQAQAQAVMNVYYNLDESNQRVMLQMMKKDREGLLKLVRFAQNVTEAKGK